MNKIGMAPMPVDKAEMVLPINASVILLFIPLLESGIRIELIFGDRIIQTSSTPRNQ
ncbi:hypothetical protein [Paenibacillus alvei]|uniref:hypothetical protein n=1 Tax=Paenibacillus alvei TaxID=44250 RepID=UPI001F433798|nr:hypothetical protein [Paenibacillus alvei]